VVIASFLSLSKDSVQSAHIAVPFSSVPCVKIQVFREPRMRSEPLRSEVQGAQVRAWAATHLRHGQGRPQPCEGSLAIFLDRTVTWVEAGFQGKGENVVRDEAASCGLGIAEGAMALATCKRMTCSLRLRF
jgi:hypothetical protein